MGKKKKNAAKKTPGVIATNRRARHDYTILESYEAGIQLVGTEIKSLREGKASLAEAFATIDDSEVWLRQLHIPEYSRGSWTNHSPRRTRKLLLHRREIDSIEGKVRDGRRTLVPLQLYFKNGMLKVELGLAEGKQDYDKRQAIRRRTEEREVVRSLGRKIKGMKA
ncbi:single-stranded DNA-binding protein [Corynebacterium atypicum]|uniref:SsrA-binding protein n=1 Tax=Corynebacterium atypicum TaxID=191610 RepID=A0ABM5QM35_9CORY|nr:SsrA-binding protein SmpB [Corynebacterium atypicum]AIG63826.1 single-stranded DNA-binding protein [Corynebacterium atypicum]